MWFYDWISVRQQHQVTDIVGENICIWVDSSDGSVISEGVGFLSHKGSFSTAVQIRCYGGLVEWSGNPSRWNRPDNLFGFKSIDECMQLINSHLMSLGIPVFSKGGSVHLRRSQSESENVSLVDLGAVFTRVDVTRNVSCGNNADLSAYIRAASSAVYRGKNPSVFPGSVAWGASKSTRIKMYDKSAEILAHNKNVDHQTAEYRKKLSEFCYNEGLLRQEITFGRQALRQLGLRSLDEFSDTRIFDYAIERIDMINIGCTSGLNNTTQSFIDNGFSKRRAVTLSGLVSQWYMGEPVSQLLSKSAYYRARSEILKITGLDISSSPDVSVLNTRVKDVVLSPVELPTWYVAA